MRYLIVWLCLTSVTNAAITFTITPEPGRHPDDYLLQGYVYATPTPTTPRVTVVDLTRGYAAHFDFTQYDGGDLRLIVYDFSIADFAVDHEGATHDLGIMPIWLVSTDFDDSGTTDGNDLLIWQRNAGGPATHATGDADGNGLADHGDLFLWRSTYPAPAVYHECICLPQVPEPGLLGLAWLPLALWMRRTT